MSRGEIADKIVAAVMEDLSGRRGCDIEEMVDDSHVYSQIMFDLWDIVDDILFNWEQENPC